MNSREFIRKNINLQVQYTKSENAQQILDFNIDRHTVVDNNNRQVIRCIIDYLQQLRVTLVYNFYDNFVRQLAVQSSQIQFNTQNLLLATNVNDAQLIESMRNEAAYINRLLNQEFTVQSLINFKDEQLSKINEVNYFKPAGEVQQAYVLKKITGGEQDGCCKQNI